MTTINTRAIAYLTSLANQHNHTPDKPISRFTALDGYRMISDIHTPGKTHTPGEYRTDNIRHALAYAIAKHELRWNMYRDEAGLARRLGDTETREISAHNAEGETIAMDAIRNAMETAGVTNPPIGKIQAAMIAARTEGESNWAYVGMTWWEEQERTTVADLIN